MGNLYVARRAKRRGLLLPMQMNKASPALIFPLDNTDRSELNELVRGLLSKQGINDESAVQAIVDKAEQESEERIKVAEARKEVRRLMAEKEKGNKLMQVGFRKWKVAFFRPIGEKR